MAEREENWRETFVKFKKQHDLAYTAIDNAIKLEEEGKYEQAFSKYEEGLLLIDRALEITMTCPQNPDESFEKACDMVKKMKCSRKEILYRIADTQRFPPRSTVPNGPGPSGPPPSYEEATGSSSLSSVIETYEDLGQALNEFKVETQEQVGNVLFSQDNVSVYFISPDGTVSSTSQPDTLKIIQVEDSDNISRCYLQVGYWIYPLLPGLSPCYRAEYGAFILPDVHSAVEGAAVGIILPKEAESSCFELLYDILCTSATEPPPPLDGPQLRIAKRSAPSGFARGLVSGAHFISNGLVRGAQKAGDWMNSGTPKLMEHITPNPNPKPVNPSVTKGVSVAKTITGSAVQVTSYLASAIGSATSSLGRFLAPHIQKQGSKLLQRTCNLSEQEASAKIDSLLDVAAGAVEGFGTVYNGLETSAGILASSLANNTVKVVEYKYGHPAGEVTGDTLKSMGNLFMAAHTARHYLTPKGIVKITAKETGKAVVEDYRMSYRNEKDGSGPSSSGAGPSKGAGPSSEVD